MWSARFTKGHVPQLGGDFVSVLASLPVRWATMAATTAGCIRRWSPPTCRFPLFLRPGRHTLAVKVGFPKMAVSGYVDGKAHSIQTQVLGGVDRFDQAVQANADDLVVRIDGQRSPRALQFATAGAFAAAGVTVAGASWAWAASALAGSGAGLAAGAVGSLLGLYVASLGEDNLRQALKAPQWKGQQPVQLGQGPLAKSSPQPAHKLKELIQSNLKDFPSSRQVISLAGHGNHHQVGPLTYSQAAEALRGNPVEQVILDTCLGGQLEVLARLTPWSQFVLASPQPIPAIGLPFEKMFAPSELDKTPRQLASSWVDQGKKITPSLAAWDSQQFQKALLPALDQLGTRLAGEIGQGKRGEIRQALRHSQNPDRLWSGRVELGSFLRALAERDLRPETLEAAQKAADAFASSLVNSQNDKTLTFHLVRERDDEVLPAGWRDFLKAADFRFKPGLFF